ncbi:MAG TPA: DUF805 domain-containing protein [Rhizobium sp.]|nr:DUF805 domain-containing protein [Rhizobium sp.]
MTFQESVSTVLSKYMDFNGRAARPEFWWFALFSFLVNIVASVIDEIIFGVGILDTLSALALLLPSLAVGARRLHDIDRSAWWLLLVLVPIVGWIVLIYFNVQPGQQGENQYGQPPVA